MQRANLLNYDESQRLEQLTEYKEVPMVWCGDERLRCHIEFELFYSCTEPYALHIETT